MSTNAKTDLIFSLDSRPPLGQTIVAALQHMAAIFIGIVTPAISNDRPVFLLPAEIALFLPLFHIEALEL